MLQSPHDLSPDNWEHSYQLHGQRLQEETQVKYLGVTLTKDLKWAPHIYSITNKANSTLGLVCRKIKVPSKTIKTAAYRALVRPTLEYASCVWDPHTTEDINTIEKVQHRAARWVSRRFRQTSSVDDMLLDLEWPTLQARRRHARLTMFYKVHNSLVHIDSKYLPSVSRLSHITRKSHPLQYNIPSNRTQYRQMTFLPRTIPEWNNLPTEAATAPSLAPFQARVANL
ncbi:uncharacterized protein LOC143301566 [Babylonia areolata]|uniref:uncharacterized protein LOC143301566 n=1 Tax=Babylonia areolata TaxID=304850 RepID=UPI003FD47BC0